MLPGPGIALGHAEAARFSFGISAAAAPILMALLFYRAVLGPPLPEALRPSWFILLVPPSLIYANGLALYPEVAFLENLYFFSLVLAAALLLYARGCWRWPVGAPWWAFTFPLDALAYAAARYAQDHPEPLWRALAGATLAACDAVRGAGAVANASQRCIAAGVNSACGWLPPMMNISRCSRVRLVVGDVHEAPRHAGRERDHVVGIEVDVLLGLALVPLAAPSPGHRR